MDTGILISNLTNPTLLFFVMGIVATLVKSDLEIPSTTIKFISLYLLFAIGFKGGQELSHGGFTTEILLSLILGVVIASLIPLYTFFVLKRKMSVSDAAAVAATYGSVSAVTFVAATSFLEAQGVAFGGHMVAVMALMESPAIIVGVILMMRYDPDHDSQSADLKSIVKHSFTNGSVLMILGSLIIGIVADTKQAEGIKPFTTDIFKGFLAIFLLEMGMVTAKRFGAFRKYGWFVTAFAIVAPIVNGAAVAVISGLVTQDVGNRLMFAVLAASASYIAVPAAMRLAAPKADPGLYIPMALGVTFPFNITFGMPIYFAIVRYVSF
ncbi:MAG: sodium-dependent bicarbonate transport family permease [Blastocatellia bacterium]|nr:sodium-dependent bicarbonate transport family permease [Chloracidobacterium sp.]MBL8186051.1 sodium-dependent bicarbonate transport family permease [Blastocatellia bacterium]HBE82455.1 sodium-dependent bicarbonate transport family permease [Blastocatellia bacterium]HRJ88786.1 sodium-dependent bicarbonate transport family permease [Pyrinomonadaceae bacterium]HRK48941.1 sodium-dependent bicarbonate transport family permease [Pyrinomonadaceae bacterium]